mmetsp:Transcript_17348/g.24264  ORF Transcript_17348/g.24264 Transcript_17348/m.24264 type:complete len:188 (-) Transcript_17348:281-844(-)|eukprot:CAMPEP_0185259080 /NCGR_PEP_ID=MMETSP1359-20130426/7922_1 /TAXON_ID=552665 /ORGANISM="Bigelowiella longifila, Strain CCMP242" /LENGTH=187 /DNA_ID=CAMNT_0027844857 /DNA_START=128 /DNA_END=691 /DNA_ORIENTATION=-
MREEIEVAAGWWTKAIKKKLSSHTSDPTDALEKFHKSLVEGLTKRCTGHWHIGNPMKGCAYRSLSYDSRVDPLLRRAAKDAGIKVSVEELLSGSRYIMFINPGTVKLRNVAFFSATPEVIYQDQKENKSTESSEESTVKRSQKSVPLSRGGNPLSNFVQKGLSSMGNSNYDINRYLKQQQILVPPTM